MAQQVESLQTDEDGHMTEIANLRAIIEQESNDKKLLQEQIQKSKETINRLSVQLKDHTDKITLLQKQLTDKSSRLLDLEHRQA